MDKITIPTSFNIELEFETAEFHKRLFAWLIDLAMMIAYWLVAYRLLAGVISNNGSEHAEMNNYALYTVLVATPPLLYHLVCEMVMNGQSIGKKLMGLKVISETGGRPAIHQLLLRWLLRLADFGFTFCTGGLLSSLLTRKHQRLGDMAAGTIVIKTKQPYHLGQTIFFEVADNYQLRYPAVMKLSDRDMNVIKTILDNCYKSGNYAFAARTADKIRTVLSINEYTDDVEFLETLLKDYNYLAAKG
ncbi:RDD family protein [Deminuibacter soli]|uniref:RDD family protein n=1 Tax=Deminuibacter soli TaxID=2291815 RepID=A0A3E1NM16_9BACT|nr:RDD family protein [Deminuibacter soli]RFM28963.1 RDD family protein [Deminuibacter soli]